MTIPQMQQAITSLRLLLASVRAKDEELQASERQFRRQLERAPRHAIQAGHSLDATLNIMGEIQERLDSVSTQRKHLASLRQQAETELAALSITEQISQAKAELATLTANQATNNPDNQARIAELRRFIAEASIRAGEAITNPRRQP